MEKLEEKYNEFNISLDGIKNIDDLVALIEIDQGDLEYDIKDTKKSIMKNNYYKLTSGFINLFSIFIDKYDDPNFYDDDNNINRDYIECVIKINSFFDSILESITDDNYKELAKLYFFLKDYFLKLVKHYDDLYKQLECSYKGFSMSINDGFIDFNKYEDFFNKKINEINGVKVLEKK